MNLLHVKRDIYKKIRRINKVQYDIKRLVTPEQMTRMFLLKSSMKNRQEQSVTTIFHLNMDDYEENDDFSYYGEIIRNHLPIDHEKFIRSNMANTKPFQIKREERSNSWQSKEEEKSLEM